MARYDRHDVVPVVVAALVVAALLVWGWIAITPPAGAAQPFDHSNCQYPDRWSNPADGCDNSDPAVPECIKGMFSQEAEKACIDVFVKQKDASTPVSTPSVDPAASHDVVEPNVSTCAGK